MNTIRISTWIKASLIDHKLLFHTFDFDSNKIWFNLTKATGDSNYTPTAPSNVNYASQAYDSVPFTIADGPVPGSYMLSFYSENISRPFFLLPVNSGNTILMQGKDFKMTGVCQKI